MKKNTRLPQIRCTDTKKQISFKKVIYAWAECSGASKPNCGDGKKTSPQISSQILQRWKKTSLFGWMSGS